MSRESLVFVLGFLVFLAPFLGVPQDWKEYFLMAAGVMLMIDGFVLRRMAFLRSIERESGERRGDAFAESIVPPGTPAATEHDEQDDVALNHKPT